MQSIKKLLNGIVNKNSLKQTCNYEKALVSILRVLYHLNNVIVTSFNESNFYKNKDNKKDIDIEQNNYNIYNIFEYKYSSKKSISYKNIFEAFECNSYSYLSNLNEIFILISTHIKELYKINMNNKNKNNQKISSNNLIKWKFILSCLKIYIYSYYAVKDFNINKVQFFSEKDLLEIAIQHYLNCPQNDLYLNIFLEIIKLICCEKCPEYLIIPFLQITKKNEPNAQNEFILQLKNSLEKYLKEKKSGLIRAIFEILKTFYTSSNNTIINFFNNSEVDNNYKNNFINCVIFKLNRNLNEENEYSDSEIFNSEDDNEDTYDGNDRECFKENESFHKLLKNFIEKCNC